MTDIEAQQIVKAAAQIVIETMMRTIEDDPHQWSSRPCPTCQYVSSVLERPFGCSKKLK